MWRYNWRAFYRQWNCQVRSAQQSVCHDEERADRESSPGCRLPGHGAVLHTRDVRHGYRRRTEGSTDHDDGNHGNRCEWTEWARSFRRDFWDHFPPQSTLEAFGWGTCVMLGLHLNHLWGYMTHKERGQGHHHPACPYTVVLNMPGSTRHIREVGDAASSEATSGDTQVEQNESSQSVPYDDTGWSEKSHIPTHDASFREGRLILWPTSLAVYNPPAGISLYDHPALQDRWPETEMQPQTAGTSGDAHGTTVDGSITEQSRRDLGELYTLCKAMIESGRGVGEAEQGQYGKAVEAWRNAAGSGTTEFNLGVAHMTGRGIPVDLLQAADHFHQGSLLGHSRSQYNLAMLYLEGQSGVPQDTRRAIRLLHKAARAGLAQAQTQLGVLYTENERRDMKRAASWFQIAARQNDCDAQYYLGVCFENGWGVTKDKVKARCWYELAAEAGHRDAMYNLAVFQERGLGGLREDPGRARELYEQAAAAGDDKAKSAVHGLSSQAPTDYSTVKGLQIQLRSPSLERSGSSASSPTLTDYMRQSLAGIDLDFDLDTHQDDLDSDLESTTGSVKFSLGGFDDNEDTSDFSVQFDPDFEEEHPGSGTRDFSAELRGMSGVTFGTHNELLGVPGLKHSHSACEMRALHF